LHIIGIKIILYSCSVKKIIGIESIVVSKIFVGQSNKSHFCIGMHTASKQKNKANLAFLKTENNFLNSKKLQRRFMHNLAKFKFQQ